MYDNFTFDKSNSEIGGYIFSCDSPKYVMCIIHGIGEYAGRYARMADKLAERGIAAVSMDLRGHGISSGVRGDAAPRLKVLSDIDNMIGFTREKYPDIPLVLYGHSMGGNICLDYKARGTYNDYPVKYIVSAPWIELVRNIPKSLYRGIKLASKIMPKKQILSACEESDLGNPDYVRPYKSDILVHDKISLRCAVDGFDIGKAIAEGINPDNHRSDGKPFLLMHGDSDKICSIEGTRKLAKRLEGTPGFTYIEWPGYCHEIHNGGPNSTGDEVIRTIGDFILD